MADLTHLKPGLRGQASVTVTPNHLAPSVGSGGAPVFASPMMIALMEGAAVDCVEALLPAGHESLGTHLDIIHSAATPEGLTVIATATLVSVDGRKLVFDVDAHDGVEPIGRGRHTRVIVDTARFMARLAAKSPKPG